MEKRSGITKSVVSLFYIKTFNENCVEIAEFCSLTKKRSMEYNVEEINRLIKARRSVFPKQYAEGKPVDDAIVTQILENATWAPNHGCTEPWKFVVFTGEGLQKLATFQAELYKKEAGANFKEATYQNLLANPVRASHVIALCMKRDPNKKFAEQEEVCAVACAVQNMYLTTTAYGLGGYWTTGGVTYKQSAKAFFGLGEEDKLLGFFYLAQVAVPSPNGKRSPLEEKVEWVR
jgi:nitroreductase